MKLLAKVRRRMPKGSIPGVRRQKATVFGISGLRFRGTRPLKPRYGMLKGQFVIEYILSALVAIGVFFRSRTDTAIEVLALRQQLAVLKRKRPRPTLNSVDRLFWTTLRVVWCRWADVLVLLCYKLMRAQEISVP